jgi:maltoporin
MKATPLCGILCLVLTGASPRSLAPQVSLGNRFFGRPVLRVFITYAQWSNDFVGQVGGQDYLTDHNGSTYGLQMEAWW